MYYAKPERNKTKEGEAMKRRIVSAAVVLACVLWVSCTGLQQTGVTEPYSNYLTTINPKFMVTPQEALQWHEYKDKAGPT